MAEREEEGSGYGDCTVEKIEAEKLQKVKAEEEMERKRKGKQKEVSNKEAKDAASLKVIWKKEKL